MQKLLSRISDSDHSAFAELYEMYYKRLYVFVRAIVKEDAATKDIVSESFITLWNNRTSLPHVRNINAYIYVVARNNALQQIKSRKRLSKISLEDASPSLEWHEINNLQTGEQQIIQKELEKVMNKAIEALPPRCKMVFYLIRISKLSYKEVAEILSIGEGTVHTQLSIAMMRLKETLRTYRSHKQENKQKKA